MSMHIYNVKVRSQFHVTTKQTLQENCIGTAGLINKQRKLATVYIQK